MKHSDFVIGERFQTAVGTWVCTDIGTRTISAIRIPSNDLGWEELHGATIEQWIQGPPYAVKEELFNEKEMGLAFRNTMEAIARSMESRHPGFLSEDAKRLMEQKRKGPNRFHPLLDIDRVQGDAYWHPYATEGEKEHLKVLVFEVFERRWHSFTLPEFLDLPVATEADIERLADLHGLPARPLLPP